MSRTRFLGIVIEGWLSLWRAHALKDLQIACMGIIACAGKLQVSPLRRQKRRLRSR